MKVGDIVILVVVSLLLGLVVVSAFESGRMRDKALRDSTTLDICQHTCERLKEVFVPRRQSGCYCVDPLKVHKGVAMIRDLKEHLDAGHVTDLEGNCKLCGKLIETPGVHLMHDPDTERAGAPLDFCSAECLYKAEHIFDGLPVVTLQKIRNAIDAVEKARS